ncbi:MAG: hypothetical protein ACRD8Z_15065 [Nitrososphaeraceae archaeon]
MKNTRLNIVYDLPLKKIELPPNTIENNKILQPMDKIYFVICNSCYWCASYFGLDDLESLSGSSSHVLDCPICNSHNTELMPISNDESFRIEYSLTRGMELEFYKSNKVVLRQESVNTFVRPG